MKKAIRFLRYFVLGIILLLGLGLWYGYQPDIAVEQLKPKYAPSPSRFVTVNGLSVHYRDEGTALVDSIPLVLIHGTGASLHTWEGWVAELKDDFRLISLDLPAYGLTGPTLQNEYSLEFYADFLAQFLEKLQIQQCYLAGNSLGGGIAWRFALKYPQSVKKLILIDAGGYPMNTSTKSTSVPIAFRIARMPIVSSVAKYITPRFLAESSLKNVYFDDAKITPQLIDRYWELTLREGNRAAFMARMKPSVKPDSSWQQIHQISIPVLLQWGQHDGLIPLAVAERFAQDLPNDTLIVYANAGHVPMEEIPQQTARDAKIFLKKY